ncbi:hypothetical protein P3S67_019239 [Capsicum chacoense]
MLKKRRGRPKKQTNTDEEPAAKRGSERLRKAPVPFVGTDFATPTNSRGRSINAEPVSSVGADFATLSIFTGKIIHVEPVPSVGADFATPPNYRGRATYVESVPSVGTDFATPPNYRGRATHAKPSTTPKIPLPNIGVSLRTRSGRERGRGSGYPLESWFTCSQGSTTHDASNFTPRETIVAARERGKVVGNTSQYKRPRMTRMGVFQAKNALTTINPGLSSRRIVSTGPKQVMKSTVVSGDIDFKPSSGLKWKGKKAITTRRLQQIRVQSRHLNNTTMHTSSSSQLRDPWKL